MGVDIDIGHALYPIFGAQGFDHHAKIVEHAEAGCVIARRVMQAPDRLQGPRTAGLHHIGQPVECRTDDPGAGFIQIGKYRGVSVIEQVTTVGFGGGHEIDVLAGMKARKFRHGRHTTWPHHRARGQRLCRRLREKCALPIDTERVSIPKAITTEPGIRE